MHSTPIRFHQKTDLSRRQKFLCLGPRLIFFFWHIEDISYSARIFVKREKENLTNLASNLKYRYCYHSAVTVLLLQFLFKFEVTLIFFITIV